MKGISVDGADYGRRKSRKVSRRCLVCKSTSEKPAPQNDYNQRSTALFQNLDKVLTGAVKDAVAQVEHRVALCIN